MNRLLKKTLLLAGVALAVQPVSAVTITGMFDSSGQPLLDRLKEGGGLAGAGFADLLYEGQTRDGLAQAGLFENLVIAGDNGTQLTLERGIVLTSGFVTGLPTSNTSGSYSGVTDTGGNNYFRDFPSLATGSRHGGRLQAENSNILSFEIDVPSGVTGIGAKFVYASEEYPEWSGSVFADGFAFVVEDENYAKLPDGSPVSLLKEETNFHFMPNGDNAIAGATPIVDLEYDGFSRVLEVVAPIREGKREVAIVVADTGDQIYDSAVFLSSLYFIFDPLAPTDIGVKHRHSDEDDDYVEFETHKSSSGGGSGSGSGTPVPDSSSLGLFMAGVFGMGVARSRMRKA